MSRAYETNDKDGDITFHQDYSARNEQHRREAQAALQSDQDPQRIEKLKRFLDLAAKPGLVNLDPIKEELVATSGFITKDSGERQQFASGMQRDTTTGKARPDLVRSGPMHQRWVNLLTRGAHKYDANNWMKATGLEEHDRFLESAARHFEVWFMWRRFGVNVEDPNNPTREPLTEDHGAAVFFNINGVEYVAEKQVEYRPVGFPHDDDVYCPDVAVDVCCQDYANCQRACTPRGEWNVRTENEPKGCICPDDGSTCWECGKWPAPACLDIAEGRR